MRLRIALTVGLLSSCAYLAGCASSVSGGTYTREQTRTAQQVDYGTVESVRQVAIEGTKSGTGTVAGAALGGIAGSGVGKGMGSAAAAVGGAVIGGLIGSAVEEGVTAQYGFEIVVRLQSGRAIAVTQATDENFFPGERVRVLTAPDGTARVTH